jgi:hypothetical protein
MCVIMLFTMGKYSLPEIITLSEGTIQQIAEQSLPQDEAQQDVAPEPRTPKRPGIKLPGVNPLVAQAVHEILEAHGGYPVIESPDSVIILNNPPELTE